MRSLLLGLVSEPKKKTGPPPGPFAVASWARLGRKGCPTTTGGFRGRVDEREAARQPLLDVVECGAVEIEVALLVHHDRDAVHLELPVVGGLLSIELQRVGHARASTAPHAHAQKHLVPEVLALLERLHLFLGRFCQCHCHPMFPPPKSYLVADSTAAPCRVL